ncbi:hypothetical protein RHSIM_Rhsim07G0006900 [Rhododendron simsii]|uniref:Mitochondrial carrier protein MTM1 n=1 Tax=Rhododendron simsii TaxID=118357 RepID=A0A834LI73_RHOSS|nr:hypothetical protein RHSIM_Rhsim07G0006900 [Rhododendron simsii]
MVSTRQGLPPWVSAAASSSSRVEIDGNVTSVSGTEDSSSQSHHSKKTLADFDLSFGERAFSAAGAAVLSAVLVNPLDVAKTRLQAQAAGIPCNDLRSMACFETNTMLPDMKCSPSCTRAVLGAEPACHPDCSRYTGTIDVFNKVVRQEGLARLWRGTNASLALAVPTVAIYLPCYDILRNYAEEFTSRNAPILTPYVPLVAGAVARSFACITCYPIELARTRMQAFKEAKNGVKPPGVWKTLAGIVSPVRSTNNLQNLQSYRILWTGLGAQLARDVPFSVICWATLEPMRRKILGLMGDEPSVADVLGANFCAGFVAGSLAAAATCPLDVAKTRRQIEKDPSRALKMTTKQTLLEIWRDGGMRGLFTGVGPRVARAGPSVGIVVSFYEVVKYAMYIRRTVQ